MTTAKTWPRRWRTPWGMLVLAVVACGARDELYVDAYAGAGIGNQGGVAGSGGGGGGGGAACDAASDCPAPANECSIAVCASGACGSTNVPQGTALSQQTPGDCKLAQCDGQGHVEQIALDTDLPVVDDPCASAACTDGVPSTPPRCSGATALCCQGTCLAGVAQVAATAGYTCARRTDDTLWCWGANSRGQLGDGTTIDKLLPTQVTALGASVAEVAVGELHSCARKTDDTLWCWGANSEGQLGDGTTLDELLPTQVSALGASVAEVAAGAVHSCARKTDDTLWCWGANWFGMLGDGTSVDEVTPTQVAALGGAVATVSARHYETCASKTDNTLWCWGQNYMGELGIGTAALHATNQVTALGASVAEISVGQYHACARMTGNRLWCWGANWYGEIGDGTMIERDLPVEVAALGSLVAEVSGGFGHTCARTADNRLWCWGANWYGEIGDGTTGDASLPVEVTALGSMVAEISAGGAHTCARKAEGTLWCWGHNSEGQLGDGSTVDQHAPVEVTALGCP